MPFPIGAAVARTLGGLIKAPATRSAISAGAGRVAGLARRVGPTLIGGAAAGAGFGAGQRIALPSFPRMRRRRGRGISAAELRGFRKVANLIKTFTAPGRRTMFRTKGRRR